jgi:hypothetical protein
MREHAAANALASLEDDDVDAVLVQFPRRSQARSSGANDRDVDSRV